MSEKRNERLDKLLATGNSQPYYQLLGMRIAELGEGKARLVMPANAKLIHSGGFVHGGAIASLADEAAAYALFTLLGPEEEVSTVEIKLNFLRPTSEGELTAQGRVIHKGKRIAVADVDVAQENGKLVAKGIATMMVVAGPG